MNKKELTPTNPKALTMLGACAAAEIDWALQFINKEALSRAISAAVKAVKEMDSLQRQTFYEAMDAYKGHNRETT